MFSCLNIKKKKTFTLPSTSLNKLFPNYDVDLDEHWLFPAYLVIVLHSNNCHKTFQIYKPIMHGIEIPDGKKHRMFNPNKQLNHFQSIQD